MISSSIVGELFVPNTIRHISALPVRFSHQTRTVLRRHGWSNTESLNVTQVHESCSNLPNPDGSIVFRWTIGIDATAQVDNRSAVTPFRCLAAMSPEGSTRAGILPGHPSIDRRSRGAEVGFEPRTFRSVNRALTEANLSTTSSGSSASMRLSQPFFLRLSAIWRLMDLRAPSYSLFAGMDFPASIMDSNLNDVQWSGVRKVEQTAMNTASIAPFTFYHASSTCSLPVQYWFTAESCWASSDRYC
ncbi:hypothetical protein CSKR_108150 [Clonorchis sinensis]|uniref:Uncharacterized protein n=1 Tax=Clonorchis sinensis TaxID=79923 RepID=A0A3R7D228_CLOSI|nr:hypothetical protein CSKR_108150 [Clonorchis sinensis]